MMQILALRPLTLRPAHLILDPVGNLNQHSIHASLQGGHTP